MLKRKNKQLDYNGEMPTNRGKLTSKLLIFTPTTGLVRMEWVRARYGQIIPTNWSNVEMHQWLSAYMPLNYQLADAQNLMAKYVVENDFDWIVYIEQDNVLPPDGFIRFNEYMLDGTIPVVSGLYFTKSNPPEPLIFRGRGTSHFEGWKVNDRVWCDGMPFGFRLEHASLIKEAWKTSPEYRVADVVTRRVFDSSPAYWFDPDRGMIASTRGTTDLIWCTRLIDEKILEKAGWAEIQKLQYPFLVDTKIYAKHIDLNTGAIYPDFVGGIPQKFISSEANYKGIEIK